MNLQLAPSNWDTALDAGQLFAGIRSAEEARSEAFSKLFGRQQSDWLQLANRLDTDRLLAVSEARQMIGLSFSTTTQIMHRVDRSTCFLLEAGTFKQEELSAKDVGRIAAVEHDLWLDRAAEMLKLADLAVSESMEFMRDRSFAGQTLIEMQAARHRLANTYARMYMVRRVLSTARSHSDGHLSLEERRRLAGWIIGAYETCAQLLGGRGFLRGTVCGLLYEMSGALMMRGSVQGEAEVWA